MPRDYIFRYKLPRGRVLPAPPRGLDRDLDDKFIGRMRCKTRWQSSTIFQSGPYPRENHSAQLLCSNSDLGYSEYAI